MNNRRRAQELLKQMTLTEKVGQLAQKPFGFDAYTRNENGEIVLTEEFKSYVMRFGGIGMLCGYFRADPWTRRSYQTGGIVASERERAYNILQKFVVENTRLGIHVLIEEDAPHGRQVLDSVIYPVSLNIGCSFNHHFWGDVSAWFIAYIAGIQVNPRFNDCDEVLISPAFISKLSFAEGTFVHRNGEIVSRWERIDEGNYILRLSIPDGVLARLRLPKGYCANMETLSAGTQTIFVEKV